MAEENQELRRAGLKVTLPRVKILQILESAAQ
ncbi:MAG: ferric iron uptake transcriptional regulator, partial [Halioglobus sp.]|nr:ferric iron uptake transcriptional regulator [Halioglobus sp.]